MFEGLHLHTKTNEQTTNIDTLDVHISEVIDKLSRAGLDMRKWMHEYENLPSDSSYFEAFLEKLTRFSEQRADALNAFEFGEDMSEEEKQRAREFDKAVMAAYKDHENFLGNGATAEVYGMADNDTVCVKFIINQERYDENNHIRVEFGILSRVYSHTKDAVVRTPYPIFLRIHARDGHSYGMEKIKGASLSQITEFPEKYPELITLARTLDKKKLEVDLLNFVTQMHEVGVVHGDLYRRNIMLDSTGRLFVIDFGKAKNIDFKGDREEECKLDMYCAKQALTDFFNKLDLLTN